MSIKLKMLRVKSGSTLQELADATGLTKGYLSKLERGLSEPSVGAALKLAKALQVPVDEVFARVEDASPIVVRRATPSVQAISKTPRVVSSALPEHKMMAFVLNPSDEPGRKHPMSNHVGEEIMYVLSGEVFLQVGDRKERLVTGDSAHFNASMSHRITSIGKKPASVLLVVLQAP